MRSITREDWRAVTLPANVMDTPAMLRPGERKLIHYLTRKSFLPDGLCIDAGAFLGGSSVCIASALMDLDATRDKPLHAYDLFSVERDAKRFIQQQIGDDLDRGESFRYLYDRHTLPYRDLIDVHHGNILDETWKHEDRIDLLFLDLCKTPEFNAHVMRTFFPSLAPGSHIIHQDFYYWLEPSIHVTMWMLRNNFDRYECETPSQAYRLKSAIDGGAIDQALGALSDPTVALDCMDAQIDICEFDGGRAHIEMARCVLLKRFGRELDIDRAIDRIRKRYSDLDWLEQLITEASQRL